MMAKMKSLAFIFCLQAVLVAISIPTGFCRLIQPNDQNLIEKTCKNTPNYNLCIQILKSDPTSAAADVAHLALIVVNAVDSNAKQTLTKIKHLSGGSQKEALDQCKKRYEAITTGDVTMAMQALPGNPKFAENGMADVPIEASACEDAFGGSSPFSKENQAISDIAGVARAIIRNLL